MSPPQDEERVWHYYIDTEGHLWHEETELEDPKLLKFFMQKMEILPDGRFQVICQGETCFITAEDVPYVVQNIIISPSTIELIFSGGYQETLDPKTLWVGKANVLYCKVRQAKFTARFNRKSYFELSKLVKFNPQKNVYFLTLDDQNYPIKGVGKK
jgi:hypothetical protein